VRESHAQAGRRAACPSDPVLAPLHQQLGGDGCEKVEVTVKGGFLLSLQFLKLRVQSERLSLSEREAGSSLQAGSGRAYKRTFFFLLSAFLFSPPCCLNLRLYLHR